MSLKILSLYFLQKARLEKIKENCMQKIKGFYLNINSVNQFSEKDSQQIKD